MNSRTGFYILLAAFSFMWLYSCLGSNDTIEYEVSTDAQLVYFSLSHDSLAVLATAKFSIDQAKGLIYNYDSLPYLTDTAQIASQAIVQYTAGSGSSPYIRVEYLDGDTAWIASGDSVRIASPFELALYAPDGYSKKTYTVSINIHQIDPDSVQYVPATDNDIPEEETADYWETITQQCINHCPDTLALVTCLGFVRPDEEKGLTLIFKDKNNDLRFAFSNDLLAYQSGNIQLREIIPDDFPVEGFTRFNDGSFAGRLTIISSLQSVWATEDGLYWTNLSGEQGIWLPMIEGGNAFFYNNEIWFINGRIRTGGYNSQIYFSRNGGIVWEEKPEKMNPPDEFPLRQNAKVVVDEDGKYFYIVGGQNQGGTLNDVWKVALNSRLFDH